MPIVKLNDVILGYDVCGKGEPVLFIHGLGSCQEDWAPQVEFFSKHYKVITVDIRGHGQSVAGSQPMTVVLLAQDILALLDYLGLPKVHVVGLSLGGMVAFQLAVLSPRHVKTLTIINSGPECVPRTFTDYLALYLRHAVIRLFGLKLLGQLVAKNLFPRPEQAQWRKTLADRIGANDKQAYLAVLRAITGWSVTSELEQITLPVLVISGDADYTSPQLKMKYLAKLARAKMVIIRNSRHATPIDQSEVLNRVVNEFLQEHYITRAQPIVPEEQSHELDTMTIMYQ